MKRSIQYQMKVDDGAKCQKLDDYLPTLVYFSSRLLFVVVLYARLSRRYPPTSP